MQGLAGRDDRKEVLHVILILVRKAQDGRRHQLDDGRGSLRQDLVQEKQRRNPALEKLILDLLPV